MWGCPYFYLSHPSSSFRSLDDGDSVVDGSHRDRPGQVLGVVAGDDEDDPLLSGDVLPSISPTPALLAAALMYVMAS